jgi:hypothetical protein
MFALCCLAALRADPFKNLGFDDGNTNNLDISGEAGFTADLLPGWSLYQGSTLLTMMYFNDAPDSGSATLLDRNGPRANVYPPEGSFELYFDRTLQGTVPYSLLQRGDVPQDSRYLRLRYGRYSFQVSLNGTNIPALNVVDSGFAATPRFLFYDVASFTGKTVELMIKTTDVGVLPPFDEHLLDSVGFFSSPAITAIAKNDTNVIINWDAIPSAWLEQATSVNGPWVKMTNRISPASLPIRSAVAIFVRIRNSE